MNRTEFIGVVCEQCGREKKEVDTIVDTIFSVIRQELNAGNKVMLSGFGTFLCKEHKGKSFYNPKKRTYHELPARVIPSFHASGKLKKAISNQDNGGVQGSE